jgi:hypothetical protein
LKDFSQFSGIFIAIGDRRMNGLVQYAMFRIVSAVGMQIYSVKAFFGHDGGSDEFKRSNAGELYTTILEFGSYALMITPVLDVI